MLKDLIESSSHNREFKRRGSFFIFTLASYVLFLIVAGVVSIVAYEARLEDRITETVLTMLPPAEVAPSEPTRPGLVSGVPRGGGNNLGKAGAKDRIAAVDHPKAPDDISTDRNPTLPYSGLARPDSGGPGFGAGPEKDGPGSGGNVSGGVPRVIEIDEGPPTLKQEKPPRILKRDVINSQAISLPKPVYPPIALRTRTQGKVTVQVLIDESGKVISVKSLAGNPLLTHAAIGAAYQARFSPTFIGDHPVKVSGLITYNFVID